jgi:Protein of unknown function (DUF1592)/Protein of unknown function (DUF1588)/Protein of unknown function (DUF1585)/Protein of unknown function (DUF1595)/Protein of unknown function (DUF1587)/Planctomycete cytochrome C
MKACAVAVVSGLALAAVSPHLTTVAAQGARAGAVPASNRDRAVRPTPRTFPHAAPAASALTASALTASALTPEALNGVVKKTCGGCHSAQRKMGNLVLEGFDVATAAQRAETTEIAEKVIGKLQAGMMPPPGRARPKGDTLAVLQQTLERLIDARATLRPEPGHRAFQRLNRAEYARSIWQMLALEIDPGKWLPLDTKSANFDNIADVQLPSATLLDAYLDAASGVSRLAVGDPRAAPTSVTYKIPRLASQLQQVEGAPTGTRGGTATVHNFPADGEYVFAITLHSIPTGQLYGSAAPIDEKVEIAVNGERVALIEVDRWMSQADPSGMELKSPPIRVRAGAQRISAAFVRTFEGPVNDLIAPIGHSIADTQIGADGGITILPHLRELVVLGPYNPTGVSETASRKRIFTCRPLAPAEARPCAQKILTALGTAAYRRPLGANDLQGVLRFYDEGAKEGGFEAGVRFALEAILSSPHFIFRVEEKPAAAKAGETFVLSDLNLASRLSFFLWGAPPDEALLVAARRGALRTPAGIAAQARRMLADRRSQVLASRFAAQWLRLQDLDKVHPDALQFPDFHQQLADDMRRETETFFAALVRENRSVLDLYTANYTWVNEALARHYGWKGIVGPEFRRVQYPDSTRVGLLGHASILTLTSVANRTSPVLRGKWVMEVLLGSPPPPPPPGVPDLDETKDASEGRMLTTRERVEMHRDNAACRSCHLFMDPIGLALDNFDVTGRWRIREHGMPLDTRGDFYDGTPVRTPLELQRALLKRPTPLLRTFTLNLMAYATGRRMEYYDMPAIRRITAQAAAGGYKVSDFVTGVVTSDAFRATRVSVATAGQKTND